MLLSGSQPVVSMDTQVCEANAVLQPGSVTTFAACLCRLTSYWLSMRSMALTMIRKRLGNPSLLKTQIRFVSIPSVSPGLELHGKPYPLFPSQRGDFPLLGPPPPPCSLPIFDAVGDNQCVQCQAVWTYCPVLSVSPCTPTVPLVLVIMLVVAATGFWLPAPQFLLAE